MAIVYADDKLVRGSEIIELYEEAGWSLLANRSSSEVEEAVRFAHRFITARDGAKLIGFAGAISDGVYHAHITEILARARVSERVHGELLRRLLDALESARVVTIFAEPDAQAFYRGFDFSPTAGGMLHRRT